MAELTDKQKQMERRAAFAFVPPIPEMPAIPEELKANPKYRVAWAVFEKQQDEWRKTIQSQAAATASMVTRIVQTSSPSGASDQTKWNQNDVDLHSLYLMQWLWA